MSGGHGKATGESKRVGPGWTCQGHARGAVHCCWVGSSATNSLGTALPPCPETFWCKDRAHVLGCLQLGWAGHRQGSKQASVDSGCPEKLKGPFLC